VYQGQQLGIIGSTGVSVGTYLEFQVMLGTEILDPMDFLKIRSDYTNWANNW
jgi:murein DD-endopeptidase MepM/ murein hydrolase activator NlpD